MANIKWTDIKFVVSRVKRANGHITNLYVYLVKNEGNSTTFVEGKWVSRATVTETIRKGFRFATIIENKKTGKYDLGAEIHPVEVKRTFLRTDRDDEAFDNLENLPEG